MSTRILLVEDDPDLRKGLTIRLRSSGFEVALKAGASHYFQKPADHEKLAVAIRAALAGSV